MVKIQLSHSRSKKCHGYGDSHNAVNGINPSVKLCESSRLCCSTRTGMRNTSYQPTCVKLSSANRQHGRRSCASEDNGLTSERENFRNEGVENLSTPSTKKNVLPLYNFALNPDNSYNRKYW